MLVRADEKVAQCLMKLKGPEFAPLLDWLKQSLYRTTEDLVSLSGTEVIYRSQGAAKDLKEGADFARKSLSGGGARARLDRLIAVSKA